MDWSDLPFFLAVARSGQIARGAAAMGTDPTTVGRRLRRLEATLGERLFEQGPQGQTLTVAGASLFERAEAMARIAGDIGHDHANTGLTGTVRVSVAEGFGTWFVSRHIAHFAAANPGIEVDLVATSGFLNPTRRETDLAVLLARPRRGPLITRKLTDYALSLYAARDYLAAHPPIASPADLAAHRLIGYIPEIVYAPELRYLEELPIAATPRLRSSSINAQGAMIAAGAGIGVLPCFIGDAVPGLSIVAPDIRIQRSFWLTTHRETRHFGPVRLFADWLVALCAEHRALLLGEMPSKTR